MTVYVQIAPRVVETRRFRVLSVHGTALMPRFVGHIRTVS